MYFDDLKIGMTVEITIEAYNQRGEPVLKDVTEAVARCRL